MSRCPFGFSLALVAGALGAGGCGGGWVATREGPPPRPVPASAPPPVSAPAPVSIPEPVSEPESPLALPRPAAPPGTVASHSWYPEARVAEWTLATGTRLLFRRTDAEPGLVRVRAYAPGGWLAVPDSVRAAAFQTADFVVVDNVVLRPYVTATEARLEGEAETVALDDLFDSVARQLTGPPAGDPDGSDYGLLLDAEDALEAALAGVDLRTLAATPTAPSERGRLYEALFPRPTAFTIVIAGDAGADAVERAAGAALGRSLGAPGGHGGLITDARPAPMSARGLTVSLPGRGGEARALVGFRAPLPESMSERNPHDVQAGLDVLAALVVREAARALPDVKLTTKTELQAGVATLVLDGAGRSRDAEVLRDALLAAAQSAGSAFSDAALAEARGAARTRHDGRLASPEGWLDWLEAIARDGDPRAPAQHTRRLSAVTAERVRALARALLSVERAAVVLVEGE